MATKFFNRLGGNIKQGVNKLGNLVKDNAIKLGDTLKRGYTSKQGLDIAQQLNKGLSIGSGVLAPALIAASPMTGGVSGLVGAGLLGTTALSNANVAGMKASRGDSKGAQASALEAGKKSGGAIGSGQKAYTQYQKS